jgi:hypothetical protein
MSLEEKASQLVNQARAIPRLGVPAYDWWSEALHGVAREGVTEFPEPVGLGATFDAPAIHRMAVVIGTEGRIKHDMAVKANGGSSDIFQGLDFWAPNINLFRDPRWGRGQETYGEDPFLTARMGVAFVTGMQGDDPKYYRVISTPKHYAVHSGPEYTRHIADVTVSKHDELDTYLPAFRAAVTEGKADSVMCAYNSINGQPACANEFLLQDQLRDKWAFKGYVVSDCGAVVDIYQNHKFEPSQAQASAMSLKRGMDNECVDFTFKVKDDHDYKPYTGVDQLPSFDNYAMQGRTYRYFQGKPLYPFGYGLSYTTFAYRKLKLPTAAIAPGQPVSADVTVTNTGKIAGDEVAQLYLEFPDVKGAPLRALRGFERVHLEPGQSQTLHFELKERDLSMVSEAGEPIIAAGKYIVTLGGGQPDTTATTVAGSIEIKDSMTLPE